MVVILIDKQAQNSVFIYGVNSGVGVEGIGSIAQDLSAINLGAIPDAVLIGYFKVQPAVAVYPDILVAA